MTGSNPREAIVAAAREMNALGINQGTSGNISVREGGAMLITPSGVPYEQMTPDMIARVPIEGEGAASGPLAPSSEWRIHRDILRARSDVNAVVHTHATHATTLSVLRLEIPAVHYMIAAFGAARIRCTDYAPFGTQELSDLTVAALGRAHGVLLGSHGMVVTAADLDKAMWRAVELEALARVYYLARLAGEPVVLSDEEISREIERFENYGLKSVRR